MSQAPHHSPAPATTGPSLFAGLLVLVGVTVAVIGAFLPWVDTTRASGLDSRSLMSGNDGWIVIVVAAIGVILCVALLYRGPGRALAIATLVVALPVLGIVFWFSGNLSGRVAIATSAEPTLIASVGPGSYVTGIGLLLVAMGGFNALLARRRTQPTTAPARLPPQPRTDNYTR